MPGDQNSTQNQDSTENSIPPSPQEPTEQGPENTAHSDPSEALPEAPESPKEAVDAIPINNDTSPLNQPEAISQESESGSEIPENQGSSSSKPETAQIPVNEPLPESEPSVSEAKEEPKPIETPEPEPEKEKPRVSYLKSQKWGELLITARDAIQFRKRKKLDRVMSLFLEKSKITNDEVEKLLHVS